MNMINALHIATTLNNIDNKSATIKTLNTNLPMLLKVLAVNGKDSYLVQLGKLTLQTSSDKELKLGSAYWANVKNTKEGIVISNLVQQPKMMDSLNYAKLKLTSEDLKELFKEQKGAHEVFKDFLLDKLPLVNNKNDFLELANLLIALQNGVFSMVVQEEGKDASLFQMKQDVTFLEFYGIFPSLGEINGLITLLDNNLNLNLNVMSSKIKEILESKLSTIHHKFDEIKIEVKEAIPLWDLNNINDDKILNLKV